MAGGYSYNGWPASDDPQAIGVEPFGDAVGLPFPGGVRGGDVATVLGYVCTQLHERVEPCVAGWDWGWSYRANVNDPSSLSCHASATAVDYNAPNHPNSVHGTWSDDQVAEVRAILAEVQGAVQWGEDYSGTVDGMHFEIIVDATTLAAVAATLPAAGPAPTPTPEDDDVPLLVHFTYDNAHCLWSPASMTWSKVMWDRWDTVRWAYQSVGATVLDWDGPGLDADPQTFGTELPPPAFGIAAA